eukprot:TRINITY_DN75400_c0_g1_i1.p1 TRINITY_DN75400_c0_g1~~TRINITY_DN75400_c0_g1_i1.p1  ORF type:complete len:318 (+),score=55.62 TRINITY_DN75400_c0_g1_i1:41-994(+)
MSLFRRCFCCCCDSHDQNESMRESLREDVDLASDSESGMSTSSGRSINEVYGVDSMHFPPALLRQLEEKHGSSVPPTVSTEMTVNSVSSRLQAREDKSNINRTEDDKKNSSLDTRFAVMENLFLECVIRGDSGAFEDVDLPKFFKACDLYRDILSTLGQAVGVVLRDIDANLGQSKAAMEQCPSQRGTLRSYLSHEHAGLGPIMWLTRGLEFFLTMLVLLFTGTGQNAAPDAYSKTLAQYHGWFLQGVVKQGMRMMPGRDSIAATSGLCLEESALTVQQRKELVMRDGPKAAKTALEIIERMKEVFVSLNRWSTTKA